MTKETSKVGVEHSPLDSEFDLAKRISNGLGRCARAVTGDGQDSATYLWISVSKDGEARREERTTRLSTDEWLNVVDEAASIGVSRLVVSAKHSLSDFADIWEICGWAQHTHDMVVVLHTNAPCLTESDLSHIRSLEPGKTRLLLTDEAMASAKALEASGVVLCRVDRGPLDRNPCEKPGKIVFVSHEGKLYTCGLVEGIDDFHLGDIFDGTFAKVMQDPDLPHAVADQERFFAERHSCDGCPALAKGIFADED